MASSDDAVICFEVRSASEGRWRLSSNSESQKGNSRFDTGDGKKKKKGMILINFQIY